MYLPLPKCLTIKESDTHGLGLFATEDIPRGINLGVSHIIKSVVVGPTLEYIRTPLGGFYNHSEEPNCYSVIGLEYASLVTLRDVEEGEELTVLYTLNPLQHP